MIILNQQENMIVNSYFVERFLVVKKDDCHLVIASYGESRSPITLGRYAEQEVNSVLGSLYAALMSDKSSFEMPESILFAAESHKRDARTKRKGGS